MKSLKTIWIDLDNSPHVPLFRPVINELNRQGVKTIVTARDFAQTISLLDLWSLNYTPVGKHGGKNKIGKIFNLFIRANQLRKFIKKHKIDLAVSHGSRTQLLAAKWLGIPSVLMLDYEFTEAKIFNSLSTVLLMPEAISEKRLEECKFNLKKVIRYNGFKEELYLPDFIPENNFRKKISVPENKILVTIRPSAFVSNYHDPMSEKIITALIENAVKKNDVHILIVSRTKEDKDFLSEKFGDKIHFLQHAVDGLQLIWVSDLFISGGGTMNREAALLDVPTYSIFTGRKPFLDEYLEERGKMTFIDSLEKVNLIKTHKRVIPKENNFSKNNLPKTIVEILGTIYLET